MSTRREKDSGITEITVQGYKAIRQAHTVEIRPLTILAGANSSGKSSLIQPLLLLKQTLEASYDPGPLLLSGPNVKFNRADEMFSVGLESRQFEVKVQTANASRTASFISTESGTLDIPYTIYSSSARGQIVIKSDMRQQELRTLLKDIGLPLPLNMFANVKRHRCFLDVGTGIPLIGNLFAESNTEQALQDVIHLPGLRGNPERSYPVAAVEETFPGTFEPYTASLIARWQESASERLEALAQDLQTLGLTWKVQAKRLDDTRVELRVGRLKKARQGGASDLVSIADVGVGVSQTLPVLVALQAARAGQMVYIEQPEIHLHPRAQVALASVLANAAKAGKQVVVETHSALLLLAVQTLVARGELDPSLVKLHWFSRDDEGDTYITSADLDENGAFGDWAEDFGAVELEAQSRYLDAVEGKWQQHG